MFNHKSRKFKYIVTILTLSLFFSFIITFAPVQAFTNSFTRLTTFQCGSCSNPIAFSAVTIANTGDLMVVMTACGTNAAVSSITDTQSNSWQVATAASFPSNNVVYPTAAGSTIIFRNEIWFTKATAAGSDTITLNYATTNTSCWLEVDEGNFAGTTYNNNVNTNGNFPANPGDNMFHTFSNSVAPNNPSQNPNFAVIFIGQFITGDPQAFQISFTGCNANNQCLQDIAGTTTLTSNQIYGSTWSPNAQCCSVATGFTYSTTSSPVTIGVTANSPSCMTAGCGFNSKAAVGVLGALFSNTGSSPGCGNGNTAFTVGGVTPTNTPQAITSNQTYYYAFIINTQTSNSLNGLNLNVSSISLTNGQTKATLTIAIYFGSSATPSTSSPSVQYQPYVYTLTVVNNAAKQLINIPATIPLTAQSSAQFIFYYIAFGVSHAGLNVYQSSTSISYYKDSSDPFSGGSPPFALHAGTLQSPPAINFWSTGLTGCVVTSTSTNTTTITTTGSQTTTVNCASAVDASCGAFTVFGLLNYWPIWVLPLVMGGLFGIIGVFLGFIMGTVIGVLINIIPLWVVFLIGLGLFLMIVRREI